MNKRVLIVTAAVAAVILAGAIIWWSNGHQAKPDAPQTTASAKPSPQATTTVTAGGQSVPEQFWSKARALGYYCPSWDAKPGEIASNACIKLDQ